MAGYDVDHGLDSDPESDHRVWNNENEPNWVVSAHVPETALESARSDT